MTDAPRYHRLIRALSSFALGVIAVLLLWQSARLAFRYDPLDDLRRVDALFIAGHTYDARAEAAQVVEYAPDFAAVLARVGMIATVRGELPLASRMLARAIGLGSTGQERDLIRLYQGQIAAQSGQEAEARRFWSTIAESSPLFSFRRTLEAEYFLRTMEYAGAENAYRDALRVGLPPNWRNVVFTRLAALRATSDPQGAAAELAHIDLAAARQRLPNSGLAAPLLPQAHPGAEQIAAALKLDAPYRAQMLGQLYLESGLYALAEAQFAMIAPDNPRAVAALAFAAYTRWRAGDSAAGLHQLENLVATHPNEVRARVLLALIDSIENRIEQARIQLDALRAHAPNDPDTHLAWAHWYSIQHDYLAAAAEYRHARDDAAPAERGIYLIILARFHIEAAFQICEEGQPAAEEASRLLPNDIRAWVVLAATRFSCADAAGARDAAQTALQQSATDAEAAYYLGRARAALGDRQGARAALVQAADTDLASPWRQRAEAQLTVLGLADTRDDLGN